MPSQKCCLTPLSGILLLALAVHQATAVQSPLTALPVSLNNDSSFNFDLLNMLSLASYDGADTGDVLSAANIIQPMNMTSYSDTFYQLAVARQAEASAANSKISAQSLNFAAASYYRRADFYLHSNWSDPLINTYWDNQTTCFNEAIATLNVPGQRVTIPADGFDTIGIFYGHGDANIRRPTLLVGTGYDGSQEDLLHGYGFEALKRGWNVMTYEGPGQPTVRRTQGLGFRPDWEKVVSPAVDYLVNNRTDVDVDKLALMGVSLGGYLAARAAAFEPRFKALVLDGGVWSFFDGLTNYLPPQLMDIFYAGNQTEFDDILNEVVVNNVTAPTEVRWGIQQGLWSFNTHSPYELIKMTEAYAVANITQLIKIPTFVAQSSDDTSFPGQGTKVANAIGPLAYLHNFTGPAAYHCQAGAYWQANQVYFNWLEGTLNVTNGISWYQ